MTAYFFDSSALIKRYIIEVGTIWVRTFAQHNVIMIAQITPVEIVSGVMRRHREGRMTWSTALSIRLLVDRHANRNYDVIELSTAINHRAETLLQNHALRAYDSIQLASALETNAWMQQAGLGTVEFVSSDNRLLTAASAEGLQTDDPNNHP